MSAPHPSATALASLERCPCLAGSLAGDETSLAPAGAARLRKRHLVFVLAGEIDIRFTLPTLGEFILQRLVEGDVLIPEHEPLLQNLDLSLLAMAIGKAALRQVPEPAWRRAQPAPIASCAVADEALRARVARLRRDLARCEMEGERRFLHYLLTEKHIGNDACAHIDETYQAMAARIRLAPATLSRIIHDLQLRDVIRKRRRSIKLTALLAAGQPRGVSFLRVH